MNRNQSIDAVVGALDAAERAVAIPGFNKANITATGLDPRVIVEASHTFKTRLFGANAHKPYLHVELEPYEGMPNLRIYLASRPLDSLTIRAIEYTKTLS